jgi:hypothetical protein
MRLRSFALDSGLALAAVLSLTGCPPGDDLQHGVIKIDPRPAANLTATVFNGTTHVQLSMAYNECLRGFYEREPDWTQNGIDGHSVFADREADGEGWFDRLCDNPQTDQAGCEVERIEQHIDAGTLQVRYRVTTSNLDLLFLKFGPVPLEDLAGCRPVMRLTQNPIQGFNGSQQIWWYSSVVGESDAEPNQGLAVKLRVTN